MHGIDISNWQSGLDLYGLNINFCIVKASEGVSFIDMYAKGFIEQCQKIGLLWGYYHFAGGQNPEMEAEFFHRTTKAYERRGIPVLDYEINLENDREWVERFVMRYHELTGIYPMLYMSASWCQRFNGSWLSDRCALWVAGYPYQMNYWTDDVMPYNIAPWSKCAIWQFTSQLDINVGMLLDGNIGYIDADEWQVLANPQGVADKPTDDLVREVMRGLHGIEDDRAKSLGDRYEQVQARIDQLYKIADEVIAGKWGDDWQRKNALEGAGYPYDVVQLIVNSKMGVGAVWPN